MADEQSSEYELVPHKRILDLQEQVENLKRHPLGTTPQGQEMAQNMKTLSENINNLVGIFKGAADMMKKEEGEEETFEKTIKPLMDKLDEVIEQNKKIARGMVAVADMVKEQSEKIEDLAKKEPLPPGPLPPRSMMSRPMPPPPTEHEQVLMEETSRGMPPVSLGGRGMPPPPGRSMGMPPSGGQPGMNIPPPPGMPGARKKGFF